MRTACSRLAAPSVPSRLASPRLAPLVPSRSVPFHGIVLGSPRRFGGTAGYSSHLHNPFLAVVSPEATESHGEAWAFSLVYTGSFAAEVERGSLAGPDARLFVPDDGWFGVKHPRVDDTAGPGDWEAKPARFPDGLGPFVDGITALRVSGNSSDDVEFGLCSSSRKWSIAPRRRQWPGADHAYMLGLYSVWDTLTRRFPDVLWGGGCASGGGRFDPGVPHFSPQAWTSDDSDAAERVHIQFGASPACPPSAVGAHASTVPNAQTGRRTPLEFGAHVAVTGGSFGLALDPADLTSTVPGLMALAASIDAVVVGGGLWRLRLPGESNWPAALFVAADGSRAVLFCFRAPGTASTAAAACRARRSWTRKGLSCRFDGDYASRVVVLERQRGGAARRGAAAGSAVGQSFVQPDRCRRTGSQNTAGTLRCSRPRGDMGTPSLQSTGSRLVLPTARVQAGCALPLHYPRALPREVAMDLGALAHAPPWVPLCCELAQAQRAARAILWRPVPALHARYPCLPARIAVRQVPRGTCS